MAGPQNKRLHSFSEYSFGQNGKTSAVLQADETHINAILDKQTAAVKRQLEEQSKLVAESRAALSKIDAKADRKKYQNAKITYQNHLKEYTSLEESYQKERARIYGAAVDAAIMYESQAYLKLNGKKKYEYQKQLKDQIKDKIKQLAQEKALLEQQQKQLVAKETRTAAEDAELASVNADLENLTKNLENLEDIAKANASQISKLAEHYQTAADLNEKYLDSEELLKDAKIEQEEANNALREAQKDLTSITEEQLKALKDEVEAKKEAVKAAKEARDEALKAAKDAEAEEKKQKNKKQKQDAVAKQIGAVASKLSDALSNNVDALYGEQGRMMGRLQGSGLKWSSSVMNVMTTVGMSGLMSQKNIVAKMVQLVDSGVAYNLEMRAFLAETSQNIASTFNAFDSNLLRLIRLQQADTTAARLGMEATLTKLFNETFQDSSYLAEGISDSVASAILDASAALGRDESVSFEYAVQKWLGSLYSIGLSSEGVSSIAQGLNYLGTGNVNALNNNSALQSLLSLGATRGGGKSYAQMLTTGMTSDDVNNLLRGVVLYLGDIARNQSNQVTRSAYADLFNMSVTDLNTFSSLSTEELNKLYSSTATYETLEQETQKQLKSIITRLNIAQMVDNFVDNAQVGAAATIGSNPVTYGMWKALSLVKEYVGEIEIPGITAAGFGLASGMDLIGLMQGAMTGIGLVGSIVGGISSLFKGGATNLSAWDYDRSTARGGGLKILSGGLLDTTSESIILGASSGSGSDMSSTAAESGMQSGKETSGITEEDEEGKDIPKKILEAIAGEPTPNILGLLSEINTNTAEINTMLDPNRVFYTAMVGSLTSEAAQRAIELSSEIASARMLPDNTASDNNTSATQSNTNTLISNNETSEEQAQLNVQTMEDAISKALTMFFSSYDTTGIPVKIKGGGM